MAGQERHGVVDLAMRDRNAGIGKSADTGSDTRHDAERDAVLDQRQGLFAATAEDKGIAALQPQHALALARQLDQPQGNITLFGRRLAAALSGKFEDSSRLLPGSGNQRSPAHHGQ
jgi:hypothetical protein